MNYEPNVEGVLWFAREVWPRILVHRPDATFVVVGSSPTEAIRKLASPDSRIDVTGTVADVRPFLWSAAVSVAPLRTARGLQNKVLEALAAGLPAVVTPQVFEGLPEQVHTGCRVARSPVEFATETLDLLAKSPLERRSMAVRSNLESMSWDAQLAGLPDILERARARR